MRPWQSVVNISWQQCGFPGLCTSFLGLPDSQAGTAAAALVGNSSTPSAGSPSSAAGGEDPSAQPVSSESGTVSAFGGASNYQHSHSIGPATSPLRIDDMNGASACICVPLWRLQSSAEPTFARRTAGDACCHTWQPCLPSGRLLAHKSVWRCVGEPCSQAGLADDPSRGCT